MISHDDTTAPRGPRLGRRLIDLERRAQRLEFYVLVLAVSLIATSLGLLALVLTGSGGR